MCYEVTCPICGKKTWAGCGLHVDQVMSKIPKDQRCPGHTGAQQPKDLFSRLFG